MKNKKNYLRDILLQVFALAFLIAVLFLVRQQIEKRQQIKPKAEAANTIYISPATQDKLPGDEFTYSVRFNTGEKSLLVMDLILKYDPNVVEVVSFEKGAEIANLDQEIPGYNKFNNTTGTLTYSVYTMDVNSAVKGADIEILKVNAKVKTAAALGTTTLTIDESSTAAGASAEDEGGIISTIVNAEVNIVEEVPATETPTSTPTETPTSEPDNTPIGGEPGEPNSCGGTCGSNYNCQSNLYCYSGFCRNANCPTDEGCECDEEAETTATPKTKTTIKPTAKTIVKTTTKATTRPTAITIATTEPQSTDEAGVVDNKLIKNEGIASFVKYAIGFILGSVVTFLVMTFALKSKKDELPHITPPLNV